MHSNFIFIFSILTGTTNYSIDFWPTKTLLMIWARGGSRHSQHSHRRMSDFITGIYYLSLIFLIHTPMLKLESTKKGFQYAGYKACNNIPLSMREMSSLTLFKSHLKKHFKSNEN